ncbi:MAG: sulfatase-like hydrolase/transferase, partial [Acidimicrobiia bacterium]
MALINRRDALNRLAVPVTAAFASHSVACSRGRSGLVTPIPPSERPNIVLVLMDDMRWDFMACAGHSFIRTPNLDRLAREGALFENAFVSLSLCSPSRASFLTGLYSHVHGVTSNRTPLDFSRVKTFPQRFQEAGYRTAMLGKWHMGLDADPKPGFDYWACFRGQGRYFEPELNVNGTVQQYEGFTDDVTTTLAIDWIRQQDKRPFLAMLAFKSCHSPFEPPPRLANLYEGVPIPKPASFDRAAGDQPAWVQNFDDAGHRPYSRIPYEELVLRFSRLVSGADENVGRLLDELSARRELDRTLFIFSSDNGFLIHEHGLY